MIKSTKNNYYASFIKRFVAFCIDLTIIIILNTLVSCMILLILQFLKFNANSFDLIMNVGLISAGVIFILYNALGESSYWRGTPGKRLMKISVCKLNEKPIGFFTSVLRTVLKFISIMFVLGIILIFLSSKRQGFHDVILNTVVINNPATNNN